MADGLNLKGQVSKTWSSDTLQRGLSHVVNNASCMIVGDYSGLPEDELQKELEAPELKFNKTLSVVPKALPWKSRKCMRAPWLRTYVPYGSMQGMVGICNSRLQDSGAC